MHVQCETYAIVASAQHEQSDGGLGLLPCAVGSVLFFVLHLLEFACNQEMCAFPESFEMKLLERDEFLLKSKCFLFRLQVRQA